MVSVVKGARARCEGEPEGRSCDSPDVHRRISDPLDLDSLVGQRSAPSDDPVRSVRSSQVRSGKMAQKTSGTDAFEMPA